MFAEIAVTLVLAVAAWFYWNAQTYGKRSTAFMLKAWPTLDQIKDGKRFVGTQASVVFYHCRHNWTEQRADFLILARTERGQWFEAQGKVFAARKAAPFAVTRTLTPNEAQEWLGRYQARAELTRYFGTIEIA